jgi:hypothetical protein
MDGYYNQRILWFTLLVSEYVMSTIVFSTSSNTRRNVPEAGGLCPKKSPFLSCLLCNKDINLKQDLLVCQITQ